MDPHDHWIVSWWDKEQRHEMRHAEHTVAMQHAAALRQASDKLLRRSYMPILVKHHAQVSAVRQGRNLPMSMREIRRLYTQ